MSARYPSGRAPRWRFAARLVWGALWRRRSRLVIALAAIAIGSSVAAGLWLVASDVDRQVSRELKAYGPNLILVPAGQEVAEGLRSTRIGSARSREWIPASSLRVLEESPPGAVRVLDWVPVLYGAARSGPERTSVLVAGTDLQGLRGLYDGWRRQSAAAHGGAGARAAAGSPAEAEVASPIEADVGVGLARQLGLAPGDTLHLEPTNRATGGIALTARVAFVHEAGGPEDDAVYLDLRRAQQLLGAPDGVSLALVRASGLPEQIHDALAAGWLAGEGVEARPLRRMAVSERQLLDRLGVVFTIITALALLAAMLSAGSTLADLVLERRQEVALLKALGAGRLQVLGLFMGEAVALGVAGGLLGFAIGAVAAQVIGGSIFRSAIRLDAAILPPVVLLATVATLVASWLPVRRALSVQPAAVLRGE